MEVLVHKSTPTAKKGQNYIYQTFTGINKKENQDNLLVIEDLDYTLFAVFDGVGSAINSKKATFFAIDFLKKNYFNFVAGSIRLDNLMYECNKYILSKKLPETYCTYSLVYISDTNKGEIIFSSMGDSRIYQITNQYIEQLTADDKVIGGKNVISKCLGMDFLTYDDFFQQGIKKLNGSILICTDGFYTFLEEDRMRFFEVLIKKALKFVKDDLLNIIQNKNVDDSTYILIR